MPMDNNNSGDTTNRDTTTTERDCWRTARERDRRKARHDIRARVLMVAATATAAVSDGAQGDEKNHDDGHHRPFPPWRPLGMNSNSNSNIDDDSVVVTEYLRHVCQGHRSKFSTTFVHRYADLLLRPHDVHRYLLLQQLQQSHDHDATTTDTDNTISSSRQRQPLLLLPELLHQLFLSWFGHNRTRELIEYMDRQTSFTFYEFAVWCGKYSVVSALLHGGINPCVRGRVGSSHNSSISSSNGGCIYDSRRHSENRVETNNQQQHGNNDGNADNDCAAAELFNVGQQVLQRFFDRFPLRLSTYLVARVVELREHASSSTIIASSTATAISTVTSKTTMPNVPSFHCPCCDRDVPLQCRLCFHPCQHDFCEMCFWTNMLASIDQPSQLSAHDVVSCMVCGTTSSAIPEEEEAALVVSAEEKKWNQMTPTERRQESLRLLQELPEEQRTLKSFDGKKKKVLEKDHVASSWQKAVLPSLGATQDVRKDKFFAYVESDAVPFVTGCLQAGVDVNWINEYGQTALYIAVWRGYGESARMLLECGSDTTIVANGGSTLHSVAAAREDMDMLNLLSQYAIRNGQSNGGFEITKFEKEVCSQIGNLTVLIPITSDHPGAGSYMIDDAVPLGAVSSLSELFRSLPVDRNQKKKKNVQLCSDRSYFCDSEGVVRELLEKAISRVGGGCCVYPHMRFLHYLKEGTTLAPHVDLCRADPFLGSRNGSNAQEPLRRSTHTFILYLTNCARGGETCLLDDITGEGRLVQLAKVAPQQARLLLFPHETPHEGLQVIDVPKLLLRGEVHIDGVSIKLDIMVSF